MGERTSTKGEKEGDTNKTPAGTSCATDRNRRSSSVGVHFNLLFVSATLRNTAMALQLYEETNKQTHTTKNDTTAAQPQTNGRRTESITLGKGPRSKKSATSSTRSAPEGYVDFTNTPPRKAELGDTTLALMVAHEF